MKLYSKVSDWEEPEIPEILEAIPEHESPILESSSEEEDMEPVSAELDVILEEESVVMESPESAMFDSFQSSVTPAISDISGLSFNEQWGLQDPSEPNVTYIELMKVSIGPRAYQ